MGSAAIRTKLALRMANASACSARMRSLTLAIRAATVSTRPLIASARRGAAEDTSGMDAQTDLTAHIDRLSHELEILVASMPEVSSAAKHAARVRTIKGRVDSVAARIASAKERVRALHEEAFEMRRANLVKVAAEPMDELPENRQDMYRGVPEPSQSDDDDDDDDDAKRIDGPTEDAP